MVRQSLYRIASAVPTLIIVGLIVILLIDLPPGDPAKILAGDGASEDQVRAIQDRLHTDQPVWQRFWELFTGALHGDLGNSYYSNIPVTELIASALPVTLSLVFLAGLLAIVIGVALGFLAALRRGKAIDRAVVGISALFIAIPDFVVALLLLVPLTVTVSLLPASGYEPITAGLLPWLSHLLLPAFALALPAGAEIARQTRNAVLDVLDEGYILALNAKGLSPFHIIAKHVVKNVGVSVSTISGMKIATMIGSTVVVEQMFALPGFGNLMFKAIIGHDFPVLQGALLTSATIVLLVNLAVDLLYPYFNPRLRGAHV